MKERFELWQEWKDVTSHTWIYKLLVLVGIEKDASFEYMLALKRFNRLVAGIIGKSVREIVEREKNETVG